MQIDNKALARTYRLVQASGIPLTEAPPFVDPAVVGAEHAIGLENVEHDLHIALFVFASQAEHEQARGPIMAALPASNVYVLTGSNGPVLFVGYTHNDGRNGPPRIATSHLDTLGQAFAGEE